MPLWTIYHPDSVYTTAEEKQAFASAITDVYKTIPALYVIVTFIPLPASSYYRSGKSINEQEKPFIRLVVHHLARQAHEYPDGLEAGYARGRWLVQTSIQKHIIDKGYSYEFTVAEESREMWMIDGFMPPPYMSEAMLTWKKADKATPF